MSTLTKISVVVLVVLVCIVGAVFITQASIVPNYRQAFDNEQAKNKIFSSQILVAEQAAAAANDELEKVKARQAELVEKGADAKAQADQALAAALALNRTLTTTNETDKAQLATMATHATQQEDLLKDALRNLDGVRTANDKLAKEYARVEDLLKQEQSTSARWENQYKFYQEQNQELKDQLKQLQAHGGGAGTTAKAGETPVVPEGDAVISGAITAVKDGYASVNIGSAKGVKSGMKFIVYRPGGQYVGTLQVQGDVGLDSCAGVMTLNRLDAAQGDRVTTKLVN